MNRSGELAIFNIKKQYSFLNPNKPFLVKLAWRFLFKKVKQDKLMFVGRCLDCDASVNKNYDFSCGQYYCPCKINEQLRQKTLKSNV